MYQVTHKIDSLGPLVGCIVCATKEFETALKSEKKPVPERVSGLRALVDTGSDCVAIDNNLVQQLGLPPRSARKSQTIDGEKYRFKCEVGVILVFGENKLLWEGPGYCVENLQKDCLFDLIIGRNVLEALHLAYDGPGNIFTLTHKPRSA
jgi:predicted aspartyl protease